MSVVTVDDQAVFRATAREVIEATPGFEAGGEASSCEEALALIEEVKPGLVLVDVRMPGIDGIETTKRIRADHPDAVVVLISIDEGSQLPSSAADSGAVALVRKQDFGPTMLSGLWAVYGRRK